MSSAGMMKKVRVIFTVQGTSVHGWVQSLTTPVHLSQLFIHYSHSVHRMWQTWISPRTVTYKRKSDGLDSVKPLLFSVLVADFITGVPKGLMLYGLVRDPHVFLSQHSQNTHKKNAVHMWYVMNSDIICLAIGVCVKWKGSEGSNQLNGGAGMCSGCCLDETLAFFLEGVKMKEFALWRGCLCQGQRCSLHYAQLVSF